MAQNPGEQTAGAPHLGVEVGPVQAGEGHMVIGVDADLVALRVHPLHQVLHAVGHPPSHQEKGGLHPPLRQAVQQRGGGGAPGSVVKGERQQSPLGGGGRGRGLHPLRENSVHWKRRLRPARRQRQQAQRSQPRQ